MTTATYTKNLTVPVLAIDLSLAHAAPQRGPLSNKQATALLYRSTLLARAWRRAEPRIRACLERLEGIPACIKPLAKPVQYQLVRFSPQLLNAAENGPLRCSRPFTELATTAKDSHLGFFTGPVMAITGDDATIQTAMIDTSWIVRQVPLLVQRCRAQ